MHRLERVLAVTALVLVAGCATGPTYQDLEASMPPPPAGQGRLFVYMTDATEVPSFFPQLWLDGAPLGTLRTGTYLTADRPAGLHVLEVHVREEAAAFGSQGKTEPIQLVFDPGQPIYVSADTLSLVGMVKVTLTPVSSEDGQRDMQPLQPAPKSTVE